MPDIGIGIGLSVTSSQSFTGPPEDYVDDIIGMWRADTVEGGATPTSMTDLSGNGRDLATSGVTIGSTDTADGWGVAGKAIAVTDGGAQSYTAASAAAWKPLHTGTGASWWAILRATGDDTATQCLFDTGSSATSHHGIAVLIDGVRGRIGVIIYNGLGDGVLPFISDTKWSWDDSFEMNVPHVVVVTFDVTQNPGYQVWVDGRLIESWSMGDRWHTDAEQPELSSSDPTGPINWAARSNATQVWYGEIEEMGVSGSALPRAKRNAIEAWAVSEYGVSLPALDGLIVFDGNSMTDNIFYAGRWPEICTPKLWLPCSPRMRAVAGNDAIHLIDRIDEHVVPDLAEPNPWHLVLSTECLNSIANGRTKEQAYTDFVAYCEAVRVHAPLIVETIIPSGRVSLPLITQEKIDYFNEQLIANWQDFADGLARPDLDPILGSWEAWDEDYDGGNGPGIYWVEADGIHLTDAGDILKEPYWTTAINEWLAANVDIPAPVIDSVTPETGLQAGGAAMTITGAHFIYGCTVTIGGAACTSVVHVDRQTVTCVTPAGSEGFEDIVLTNPDTQADTISGFEYIPAFPDLAHALYVDGNYSLGLFAGIATTGGTSGDNDLTEATNRPAVATLNGYPIASFDGSNDLLNATGTLTDYVGGGAVPGVDASTGSGWVLFNYTTVTNDAGIGNNEVFLGDSNQIWGMGFTDEGVEAFTLTGADGAARVQVACATGSWKLLQYSYDVLGAHKLRIRVNDGAWTEFDYHVASSAGQTFLAGTVVSGCKGSASSPFGHFKLAAMGHAKTVLSDANFNSIRTYLSAKYGVSV